MRKSVVLAALLFLTALTSSADDNIFYSSPDIYIHNFMKCIKQNDKSCIKLRNKIIRYANKHITKDLYSVTDKKNFPPSKNKHDYYGLSIYFWPDPDTENGLPYIKKDGLTNPEAKSSDYDASRLSNMSRAAFITGLACFVSGNRKYCRHSASILRTWFINPETKMNPNLNYAHHRPGSKKYSEGSPSGLIVSRNFLLAIEAANLIKKSPEWIEDDHEQLKKWFRNFLTWMKESKTGIKHQKYKNNHGTWDDVQQAAFAMFTGDKEHTLKIIERTKNRLETQIMPDGRQPLELARTKSLEYSIFNIKAHLLMCVIAEKNSVNIFKYKSENGASIKSAIDFIIPYIKNYQKWPYKQIKKIDSKDLYGVINLACYGFKDQDYCSVLKKSLSGSNLRFIHPDFQ